MTELNCERKLLIITWGKSFHKKLQKPQQSERNFDVRGVSYRNVSKDIDLKNVRGDDDELYDRISKSDRFVNFVSSIVSVVEKNDLTCISINCAKGRHRSRAVARGVMEKYKNSRVEHMDK